MNTGVLFSSKESDWGTPQDFFDELNSEFDFGLDAAATDRTAKCERYFTPETDGLAQPWTVSEGRAVFCNPPYCRETAKWVKKAYEEAQKGTTIVMLLPSKTDVGWFHDYILGKAEVRFLRGRLKFTDDEGQAKNSAPFPSLVAIYRRETASP